MPDKWIFQKQTAAKLLEQKNLTRTADGMLLFYYFLRLLKQIITYIFNNKNKRSFQNNG